MIWHHYLDSDTALAMERGNGKFGSSITGRPFKQNTVWCAHNARGFLLVRFDFDPKIGPEYEFWDTDSELIAHAIACYYLELIDPVVH